MLSPIIANIIMQKNVVKKMQFISIISTILK